MIYQSVIRDDGRIHTVVFPTMGNAYEDELKPLPTYSRATTLALPAVKTVAARLSSCADTYAKSKSACLQTVEDMRRAKRVSNGELCDIFAETIYLPLILPHKGSIPSTFKQIFSELK